MRKAVAEKKLAKLFENTFKIIEDANLENQTLVITCKTCGEIHHVIEIRPVIEGESDVLQ